MLEIVLSEFCVVFDAWVVIFLKRVMCAYKMLRAHRLGLFRGLNAKCDVIKNK